MFLACLEITEVPPPPPSSDKAELYVGKRIMITDGEQVRIYKETVIVCEKVVARNSPGHSKKNCDQLFILLRFRWPNSRQQAYTKIRDLEK
jgi:hypothetical protein